MQQLQKTQLPQLMKTCSMRLYEKCVKTQQGLHTFSALISFIEIWNHSVRRGKTNASFSLSDMFRAVCTLYLNRKKYVSCGSSSVPHVRIVWISPII